MHQPQQLALHAPTHGGFSIMDRRFHGDDRQRDEFIIAGRQSACRHGVLPHESRATMKAKVIFCWSGGKDSALALNRILRDERYEVVSLLTTCNEHFQRVSMHGVRLELLEAQARAIGLPLEKIFMSQRGSNDEYQKKMG